MSFWRSEFTLEEIAHVLDQIRPLRNFSADGKVSFTGAGRLDAWIAFLVSASGFEVRTDTLRISIVRGALFSPKLKADFTEKDFRDIAYCLRNTFENKHLKTYKVIFPVWNAPPFLKGVRRMEDVTINFSPSPKTKLFKAIGKERDLQRSSRNFEFFFTKERLADLRQCSTFFIHVKATSPADANERAYDAICEILGLVNIAKDSGKYWRRSSRAAGKLPISEVLIGPHTTTHFEDGSLTHDGFWHEYWVGGPRRKALNKQDLRAWERRFDQLSQGISTSQWPNRCKSTAVRYFKAFSNPNLEESFLEGWRLFENITGTRYDKVDMKIIRASNVFEDSIEQSIMGKHLALRRNLIAHGHPIKTDDEETLAFQMLQFVLPYVERFVLNGFRFTSPEEFWEFLDLPAGREDRTAERDSLYRRLSLLDKAAQFRGESSASE